MRGPLGFLDRLYEQTLSEEIQAATSSEELDELSGRFRFVHAMFSAGKIALTGGTIAMSVHEAADVAFGSGLDMSRAPSVLLALSIGGGMAYGARLGGQEATALLGQVGERRQAVEAYENH